MCYAAQARYGASSKNADVVFDTDSTVIRIDNCITACISNDTRDFIGTLMPTTRKVKGISGNSSDLGGVMQGTIQWDLEDDDGVTHCILLPNSYYVKGLSLIHI